MQFNAQKQKQGKTGRRSRSGWLSVCLNSAEKPHIYSTKVGVGKAYETAEDQLYEW